MGVVLTITPSDVAISIYLVGAGLGGELYFMPSRNLAAVNGALGEPHHYLMSGVHQGIRMGEKVSTYNLEFPEYRCPLLHPRLSSRRMCCGRDRSSTFSPRVATLWHWDRHGVSRSLLFGLQLSPIAFSCSFDEINHSSTYLIFTSFTCSTHGVF